MDYLVRLATKNDAVGVLNLIQELALFEKQSDAVEITVDDLIKDGFENQPKFTCFVAEKTNEIVGIALVYMRYSTWKGEVLHLEDLIVSKSMRGLGIGTALLDKVVTYGNGLGVKRIGWEVLNWNEKAVAFYEKKGANVMKQWNVVQLNNSEIKNYLDNRK